MRVENIKCPHCAGQMRQEIDSYVTSRVHLVCWLCGVRGPRSADLQGAIKAFLTMLNLSKVA